MSKYDTKTILLVGDDSLMRPIPLNVTRRFEIHRVRTVISASSYLGIKKPDLIIATQVLEDGDFFQVIDILKRLSFVIPTILIADEELSEVTYALRDEITVINRFIPISEFINLAKKKLDIATLEPLSLCAYTCLAQIIHQSVEMNICSENEDVFGKLVVKDGEVVGAFYENHLGIDALQRLLKIENANICIQESVDDFESNISPAQLQEIFLLRAREDDDEQCSVFFSMKEQTLENESEVFLETISNSVGDILNSVMNVADDISMKDAFSHKPPSLPRFSIIKPRTTSKVRIKKILAAKEKVTPVAGLDAANNPFSAHTNTGVTAQEIDNFEADETMVFSVPFAKLPDVRDFEDLNSPVSNGVEEWEDFSEGGGLEEGTEPGLLRHSEHYDIDELMDKAVGFMLERDYKSAIPVLENIIDFDPENRVALGNLARIKEILSRETF